MLNFCLQLGGAMSSTANEMSTLTEYKIAIGGCSTLDCWLEDGSLAKAIEIDANAFAEALPNAIKADAKALPNAGDVRAYRENSRHSIGFNGVSTNSWNEIITVAIPAVFATGVYVGKKAIDVLSDLVKSKLTTVSVDRSKNVRTIVIYGPDGEVAKRIDLPAKKTQ
jgi:hypothetical protein